MKEVGKKDLRTLDKVTWRNGTELTVYLKTPEGDWLISENAENSLEYYGEDLTEVYGNDTLDILEVTRNGETIYERAEKLPYGAWYKSKNSKDFMACYADETTAFGFSFRGVWNELSDDWKPLNSGQLEPVPTKEWQARLIEYAKSKKYKNGNYKCLEEPNGTLNISSNEFRIGMQGVWHGSNSGNLVLAFRTGKWAEIIPQEIPEYTMEEAAKLIGHEFKIKK